MKMKKAHEKTHQHRFKCEICGKQLASEKVSIICLLAITLLG